MKRSGLFIMPLQRTKTFNLDTSGDITKINAAFTTLVAVLRRLDGYKLMSPEKRKLMGRKPPIVKLRRLALEIQVVIGL